VTPDGDEVVEASCPVIVTISNELGTPRYPTMQGRMAARRKKATVVPVDDLSIPAESLQPKVALTKQFVPTVQGDCEMLSGATPAELADRLVARLREESIL
jgi:electron transfer flavoprotein beta subunit